ncbi:MAG: hypothetical protein ABI823_21490 [Bryobacteraceae bacterium]
MKKTASSGETRTPRGGRSRGVPTGLSIGQQLAALRTRVRAMLANGLVSERGLASATGLSQPHIHHLLSGHRALTAGVADHLLACLELSLGELLGEDILGAEVDLLRNQAEPRTEVPMLSGSIGAGGSPPERSGETAVVPCHLLIGLRAPALVRIEPDAEMAVFLESVEFAVLDSARPIIPAIEGLYAVEAESRWMLRGLRQGRECTYLLTAGTWSRPSEWIRVPRFEPVGRVIPLPGFRL